MDMPTVDKLSKMIRGVYGKNVIVTMRRPNYVTLQWGKAKPKICQATRIDLGSNNFAAAVLGTVEIVNNYRFKSLNDIFTFIFESTIE